MREVAKSMNFNKSSILRLHKKHCPNAQLSIGGRLHKMISAMKQSCLINLTMGKIDFTKREITKHVEEDYGVEVSDVIVYCTFYRASLYSCVKEKKPYLSRQNVKACLKFGRKY